MSLARLTPLVLALGACLADAQAATLTKPDVHGDLITFTAEGDLWLANLNGHVAHRLTSDAGVETNGHFSPDGRTIAFNAQYDGGRDVYVISIDGGAPRRLTFLDRADVLGWTPDGGAVIFRSVVKSPGGNDYQIFRAPIGGGLPQRLAIPRGEFATFGPNGQMVYVPISAEWMNWFHYQGGSADQLWWTDLHGSFKRLSKGPAVDTTPTWCGNDVFFASERSGVLNLWRRDMRTGAEEQVTRYADGGVRYPSSDGRRVIFQHGSSLAIYDPTSKRVDELDIRLVTDRMHARPFRTALAPIVADGDLGPAAKRILYSARGQIVSAPVEQGDVRVLENTPGARAVLPTYVGDGKEFAFISDRTGENELWMANATDGSGVRQVTHGLKANAVIVRGSPDGKFVAVVDRSGKFELVDVKNGEVRLMWQAAATGSYDDPGYGLEFSSDGSAIAFVAFETNFQLAGFVHDVAAKKTVKVTPQGLPIQNLTISPDGRYVSYLVGIPTTVMHDDLALHYYYPLPWKVYTAPLVADAPSPLLAKDDEEGPTVKSDAKPGPRQYDLESAVKKIIELPFAAGQYTQIESVGGKLLVHVLQPLSGTDRIDAFDYDKRTFSTLANGLQLRGRTPDAKKLLVSAGSAFGVLDANGGAPSFPNLAGVTIEVEPVKEWRQIFRETWRIARDFFYDPGLHGVDWDLMWRRYEPRLASVGDRSDLARLQKDLVSELRCGHAYVVDPTQRPATRSTLGHLGAEFAAAPNAPAFRITKIYAANDWQIGTRSPLLEPGVGVKEGDYILAVAGKPVRADQDVQAALVGTAGRVVTLTVNDKPTMVGARTVRVRPIADEHELLYASWVKDREAYVLAHGGAEFGYAHIPDMAGAGYNGFVRGQLPSFLKPAMIYDTRYNGGGNISSDLLQVIATKPIFWFKPRDGVSWTREGWATVGYSAAICNEFNFSDGELFIESWKKMKLGPVIGKRTGGGEVGSGGGYAMIDGGAVFIPNYAAYGDGKWIIEGYGATPDVEVDQDPAEEMAGRDPQLDRTIAILKEMMRNKPVGRPNHPPFPKKAG